MRILWLASNLLKQGVFNMKRHAQTQHAAPNVENILVLKKTIFDEVKEAAEWKQETCTWFYEDTTDASAIASEELKDNKDSPNDNNKRKYSGSENDASAKKTKLTTKELKVTRPSYYFENGLRKVYPYYFTFTTFTKGRWVGENILDIFIREFRAHSAKEYERSIHVGALTVNNKSVPIDYQLKHNDLLSNTVHRHEVPVTSEPIAILYMDDDILVVNKPASIPVHPCGRYRHNTVIFILAKEFNLRNLKTIHRLDRLTSGILLFGRSQKRASEIEAQIRNREVSKEYVCRVEGNFPDGVIECKEPIEVISYKIGVCKVSKKGKDCTTTFTKISYNGTTSVVCCKPLTGRMHQIRVHLQYLGFPIVNDPLYNHEVFGPLKGRGGDIGGKTEQELIQSLITVHNAENWLGLKEDPTSITLSSEDTSNESRTPATNGSENLNKETCENTEGIEKDKSLTNSEDVFQSNNLNKADLQVNTKSESCDNITVATQTDYCISDDIFDKSKVQIDVNCYECKVRYRDPRPQNLVMYLHAWKYKGPDWEYKTELPNWASADWRE